MKLIIILLIPLFCCVMSCTDRHEEPDDSESERMNVTVVKPDTATWVRELFLTGSVQAKNKIAISSSLSGLQIIDINVDTGDYVSRGDTLAVLENVNVETQFEQNEAMLNKARANRIAMEAMVKEEKNKLERSSRLLKSHAVSVQEHEEQIVRLKNAEANLNSVKAEITQIQAMLRDSRNQMDKAEIKSPASGIIISRLAEKGSLTDNSILFYLAAEGNLEVVADVSSNELKELSPGMKAVLYTDGESQPGMAGEIRLTDQEVARDTRTARIYITPERRPALKMGTYVPVKILTGSYTPKMSLPLSAINFESGGDPVVKVVSDEGIVSIRSVHIGSKYGSNVEILSGLNEKEYVVLKAGALVNDGDHITPVYRQDGE